MTDKTRKEFEAWRSELENFSMRVERLDDMSRENAMFAAWQAATKAERERCAKLVEEKTAHRRMVRAAINGVKPGGCEYAAAILQGGEA